MLKSIQAHEQILKNHLQFIIATLFCLIIWLYVYDSFLTSRVVGGTEKKFPSYPLFGVWWQSGYGTYGIFTD